MANVRRTPPLQAPAPQRPQIVPQAPNRNVDYTNRRDPLMNINDNIIQVRNAFGSTNLLSHLIGLNLNIAPVDGFERNSPVLHSVLFLASRGEAILRRIGNINTSALIIGIANCIAPNINALFLNNQDSRERIREEVYALLKSEGMTSSYYEFTQANWATARGENGAFANEDIPENFTDIANGDDNFLPVPIWLTPEIAVNILVWIAHSHATKSLNAISQRMYITAVVSIAKRGVITDNKCERMNDAFISQGCLNPHLTPELCNVIHGRIGSYITGDNAEDIFKIWSNSFADFSLQLRITIEQTIGSGLTSVDVVREAIKIAPGFPWEKIAAVIPVDFANIIQAFTLIGENKYYGFNADLGAAKSTKFKSISYVGKEICHKYGGPDYASINNYKGWTKNPLHKAILDDIIDSYNPQIADIDDPELTSRFAQQVTTFITESQGIVLNAPVID